MTKKRRRRNPAVVRFRWDLSMLRTKAKYVLQTTRALFLPLTTPNLPFSLSHQLTAITNSFSNTMCPPFYWQPSTNTTMRAPNTDGGLLCNENRATFASCACATFGEPSCCDIPEELRIYFLKCSQNFKSELLDEGAKAQEKYVDMGRNPVYMKSSSKRRNANNSKSEIATFSNNS
jgi:hypothetical protein